MIEADRLAHASRWRGVPLAEKSFLSLGLLGLAMALPPWPGAAMVAMVSTVAALASGLGARQWGRLLLPPAFFIFTGAATLLVQVGAGGLAFADDGGAQAAQLAGRAMAAVSALLLLTVTTPMADVIWGLRRLGLPAELAEVTLATYRFIFVLQDSAATMHASQMARLGGDGWRRRLRSAGLLAAALLPRALDQARRLENGLMARGFDGNLRTLGPSRPARAGHLAAIGALLAVLTGVSLWI